MSYPKYQEYKDSGVEWVAEVPDHWQVLQLKRIASHNDEVLPENTPSDFELWYVEISDVDEVAGIRSSSLFTFEEAPSRARRIVRDGDVLVSTVRTYLRAIAPVMNASDNFVASTGFAVIRADPVKARQSFLSYALRDATFIAQVIANSVGVSYPAINAIDLMRIKLPLPPLSEQDWIATFLDYETARIDALIAEQQRLIELLQEKRQAVITQAVTKGLDPSVPMKDSGVEWLGDVPAHWEVTRIGWMCNVGSGSTPARDEPRYWADGTIPWLNSSKVNLNSVTEADQFVTAAAVKECALPLVKPGTVLMAITGQGRTRGMVTTTKIATTINQHLAYIEPQSNRLISEYLRVWLTGNYRILRDSSDGWGSTRAAITAGDIRSFPLPRPPLEEQVAIVNYLVNQMEVLDGLVAECNRSSDLLSERRSSLISAAVTGKIDVRNWQLPATDSASESAGELVHG